MKILQLQEKNVLPYLHYVAEFRLRYFKEFPYLYDGRMEDELNYLNKFVENPKSLITLALDDHDNVIGIATSWNLSCTQDMNDLPCRDDYYYLGEFIIDKEYRRSGITARFMEIHENFAQKLNYKFCSLMTVIRRDHPLTPPNYVPIDCICRKYGYKKNGYTHVYKWDTIQPDASVVNAENIMELWVKTL